MRRAAPLVLFIWLTTLTTVGLVRPPIAAAANPLEPDQAGAAVDYRPPLAPADGTIVDRFRPPSTPYGAGNRGLDYLTSSGAPVRAIGPGTVVFAGLVAGAWHVTVAHPDGLRSSYSFLAAIAVSVGDRVTVGAVVGIAGPTLHLGVRDAADHYLDPEALFPGGAGAHLVPVPGDEGAPSTLDHGVPAQADERRLLLALINERARSWGSAVTGRGAALAHEVLAVAPLAGLRDLARDLTAWRASQAGCTPAASPVPVPTGRHLLVLVGGLGSTSTNAAVDRVDTAALGYGPDSVVRFSYRGGRVPDSTPPPPVGLGAIAARPYDAADSTVDLRESADRLTDLLVAVATAEPGVPVAVIAHSQGGVVARLALERGLADGRLASGAPILVTLGSPHQGAELATAMAAAGPGSARGQVVAGVADRLGMGIDLSSPSVAQLSETSALTVGLSHPVPAGIQVRSIGASGDLVVPAGRTRLAGAVNTTVHLGGTHAHDELPGAPATTREIGLALAGRAPTCADPSTALADLITSERIARTESALGLVLAAHLPP